MDIAFTRPYNDLAFSLTSGYTPGSGVLHVDNFDGLPNGVPSSTVPIRLSIARQRDGAKTILVVTGRSGSSFTGAVTAEGKTDIPLDSGDVAKIRMSAGYISDLQDEHNALKSVVDNLSLTGGVGPYATDLQSQFASRDIAFWGDSILHGNQDGTGVTIPGVLATLVPRNCYNGGVTGETAAQIATRMLAATDKHAWATVIEGGRNDLWAVGYNQASTLASIASMVAALPHTNYMVLTSVNAVTESIGTPEYAAVIALNNALKAAYPGHVVDIQQLLVDDYDPSVPQEVTDHAAGIPTARLLFDGVHPNAAGYTGLAGDIAANMAMLDGPDVPLKPSSLARPLLAIDALQADSVTLGGAQTFTGLKKFTGTLETLGPGPALLLTDAPGGSSFRFLLGGGTAYAQISTDGFATSTTVYYSDGATFGVFPSMSIGGAIHGFSTAVFDSTCTAASFHGDGSSLTGITESQVTGLATDLAAKAPLASPTFTGVPAGPTASPGANTTQFATTAFVTAAVAASGGGGSDALGSYLVQTASHAPANAQVLASLSTGLLKVTTTTGVVSTATAGSDYQVPGSPQPGTRVVSNSGALDLSAGDWFARTLDGTNAATTLSNVKTNQEFTIELIQDATGGRAWTEFSGVSWLTPTGTTPRLATGSGFTTVLRFKQTGAGAYLGWYVTSKTDYSAMVRATTGLVSYWKLGETSGTAAADSFGANTGTYTGGFILDSSPSIPVPLVRSVSVDGSTGYITIPTATALSPTSAISVECWFRPNATTGNTFIRVVSKTDYELMNGSNQAGVQWQLKISGSFYAIQPASASPSSSLWNHLVGTYDGTTMILYLNGVQVGTLTQSGSLSQSGTALNIGRLPSGSNYYGGDVAHVAVYNTALSSATVLAHYVGATRLPP